MSFSAKQIWLFGKTFNTKMI